MDELSAHGIDDKVKGDEDRVRSMLVVEGQGPEAFIVGIEVPAVDHGIDRIDGIKVLVDENVGLLFCREDANYLCQAATAGPVVGKGML